MAYNIVKTLFEKKPELVAVHGEAKNIDLKNQAVGLADSVPSGREEVPGGAGHQGQLTRPARATARAIPAATMAEAARQEPQVDAGTVAEERLQQAADVHRGGGGRHQPLPRLARDAHDGAARRHVAVPPLRGGRDRARAGPAPGPRRLDAAARLPALPDRRALPQPADVVGRRRARALGVATIVYLLAGGDDFWDRNTLPNRADVFFGVAFVLLVLEAVRRTSGWILLFVICLFLAYAFRRARGCRDSGRIAATTSSSLSGFMYQTLEGIFGTAVDVSSSLIILFTIYGAFLQHSGAGKFFLDWSFAAMGSKHSGAGRTVVLASFLLGGPVGLGRRDDGDDRLGRVSDARARGLRQGSGGRAARRGRPRRDHLAAGAGRRGVPDRRVPEDQLSRRAADGDRSRRCSTTCRCS